MTDGEPILVERRGPVLVATLNRPEARNALDAALMTGIGAALLTAETDPEIRVAVLTGAGDRAFCAGMDLRSFREGAELAPADEAAGDAFQRLLRGTSRIPVVGAANATAVAGGFELLLGCDLIVASRDARFGLPEVKRGLFPAGGGTTLGERIPMSVALELLLTGESIDAGRAYELGLVNAVVPPEDVLPRAMSYADCIAANGPLGVAAAKELARLRDTDPSRASDRFAELCAVVFGSRDAREGALAFLEGRPPVWQAR